MAKDRASYGQENPDQVMHAASFGLTFMAEMAEQNLRQSMAAMDGMLTTFRRAAEAFGQQASRIREHTAALAEETMGNTAEFGGKLARSKDPLEWAEAQSEFLSKQAQAIATGNRNLGEALIHESTEAAHATLHQAAREASRKRPEAA